MQSDLMYIRLCSRTKSYFIAGEDALDQSVKMKFREELTVRLHSYPAVIVKYVSFFTVGFYKIHQFAAVIHHETVGKTHIVSLPVRRRHMGHMEFSLIDKILR